MKKHIIMLGAALLATGSVASAQNIFNNPDNKAYFGVRVGVDITCPGEISSDGLGIDMFKNGAGIEFGGIYNIPVVANFYVEPGVKLFYDTYSVKKQFIELLEDDVRLDGVSIRKFGMRVPVMLGYRFDFTRDISVSVFTGPELEVGFSGKTHVSGRNISMSESVYGDGGGMHRVNLLWDFGASVSYKQCYLGINGGIGMLNMNSESDPTFHESRVTIALGYNF